jgi:hypothetical protein
VKESTFYKLVVASFLVAVVGIGGGLLWENLKARPDTEIFEPVEKQISAPFDSAWLPNPRLTPGAFDKRITIKELNDPEFIVEDRHVTEATKKKVCAAYGVSWDKHADYEVDHLVPCCLGGSQDASNLWPQPWEGAWNAHDKDRVEVKMHRLVESGKLPLRQAQREIAADWIASYRTYCGEKK